VGFKIYDATGRMIEEIKVKMQKPGNYQIQIPELPAGIYFIKMILKTEKVKEIYERIEKIVIVR